MAWADLAIGGVKSFGSFIVAAREAKNRRKWQAYNNAMVNIQAGQNQNALTINENMLRERSAEEAFLIRRSEYITKASAEVAAAATGTTGRSVQMVMFDIGRNAAVADRDRQRDLDLQLLQIDESRKQVQLQAKMSMDLSDNPGPNPFSAMLGFLGENAGSIRELFKGTAAVPRNAGPQSRNDPWVQNGVNMRL